MHLYCVWGCCHRHANTHTHTQAFPGWPAGVCTLLDWQSPPQGEASTKPHWAKAQQMTPLQSLFSALVPEIRWPRLRRLSTPPPPHTHLSALTGIPCHCIIVPSERPAVVLSLTQLLHLWDNELFTMSQEYKLRTENTLKVIIKNESFAKNKLWLTSLFLCLRSSPS